jgi:putative transposase
LIEGLALQNPPRSAASIHRQIPTIAHEQGWKPPSYARVRQIIKSLDPALATLADEGSAAYRKEFDLLYRREATHANAMWQADHTLLDVWLLDEEGKPTKPYLAAIEDDYSRMIVGYRLSFQQATALTTALTLRQAIWRFVCYCLHCRPNTWTNAPRASPNLQIGPLSYLDKLICYHVR